MLESLKSYWQRNSTKDDAKNFSQVVVNGAGNGSTLLNATTFVVGSQHEELFGSILREKIFNRAKELTKAGQEADLETIAEARDLGAALILLNNQSS